MAFEIQGKLVEKYDTQVISDKFKKREFVIEHTENKFGNDWTNFIKFQITQDKVQLLDAYNVNDEIVVHFDLRGRKWEKSGQVSYFTNLEAWRIENKKPAGSSQDQAPPFDDVPPPQDDFGAPEDVDDLPF